MTKTIREKLQEVKQEIYQHDNYYLNENDLTSDWELLNMEFFKGNTNKKKKFGGK